MLVHEMNEGERPREKLLSFGTRALSNSELIALLISSGTAETSAISLASKILDLEQGKLNNFSEYEPEEFMQVKGVGVAKACSLVAAIELGRRIQTIPPANKIDVSNTQEAEKLFIEEMRYLKKEIFRIAMLDIKFKVIGKSDISIGCISNAYANPRDVFAPAIKKGAAAIIVAHNHPSGDCTPSKADRLVTKQLAACGKLLGIDLLDHLIIGDGCCTSMRNLEPSLF